MGKPIGGKTVTQGYDDAYSSITVFERSDTTVSTSWSFTTMYPILAENDDQVDSEWWITRKIAENAAGDTLYIKKTYEGLTRPTMVLDAYMV